LMLELTTKDKLDKARKKAKKSKKID